ncbi:MULTISPECIES: fused response regulator/phosphatase [unclassified Paenibacillus]|uniref:fused response regulator/phosphatase n=1 Tax=unclassified Paenibacillus TaxID=185978 RepID=UPI002405BF94|nr:MULTISPECIES: fused response regulator/phosphatase [unclassified Paenibacillus]MDF9843057.1 sigma-B regulation protein RsbU (phosphoserine phosphatase) [Paenibacillus sp. PastF-2]MDF9849731.1 sigma-B regulation protein RsbU (phosphoserine phosphatase) [Paenibacillus sp. PastM-2]MDF9856352.1 sigma-B regulation protein RsbU (phosphoserine phosphatase) [Paenibacillus sp. PastF-1]MDH6481623.1 sigma-B regulation protein RsbU (phosphoserine phosphatase) [Paenibacillus sp. PastH-2]MDH6508905.1 sig
MKILIVDDNPTNVIIIREILKKEEYRNFITASSAKEMLKILGVGSGNDTQRPRPSDVDLILLDMMMPEMDGIEACRVVQQYEHLRDIPIIMVTAVGDSKKLAEALDAGAGDYVTKPINKVELMARIRLALRLKREKDWHKERDQRIQDELKLAALVQNAVLSLPIKEEDFEVHALYQPSFELAGDLYAWFPLGDGRYAVILLDMMGHGISSSLFCMFLASVLKDTVTTYVEPEKVIQELNRRFNQLYIEKQLVQYYFTAIYLVIDSRMKRIDYVNAGHPPGLFFEGGARVPVLLQSNCHPVGLFDRIDIQPQSLSYEEEGHLVLYTDGLLEMAEGDQEDQLKFMTGHLNGGHEWREEAMREAFFIDESDLERDDDKCLVWITLGKGTDQ